jgi:hypothetical protein
MTPSKMYGALNKFIWRGRLPKASVMFIANATLPDCHGLTLDQHLFARPVIMLNADSPEWPKTLVHEMLHVAEPRLRHGQLFDVLIEGYWRMAKKHLKGIHIS